LFILKMPLRSTHLRLILSITLLSSSCTNGFIVPNHNLSHPYRRCQTTTNQIHNRDSSPLIVRASDGNAEDGSDSAKVAVDARKPSFEDAQVIGEDLARILTESCGNGEPMPDEAISLLRALISTTSGARGWFVSLLTNPDFEPVFIPPIDESFLIALNDNPDPNIKLMTMNVAMSTATEITHLRNGNDDFAEGSRTTSRRATVLAREVLGREDLLPGLRAEVEGLMSAVDGREGGNKEWIKFCKKWGYGEEEKEAIRKTVEKLLGN